MRMLVAVLVASAPTLMAQAPSTDIYLAPLTVSGGRVTIGTPVNITSRRGYDNQPSFTPDGRSILYTSTREDEQADTYRYDLASKSMTRVLSTAESEYSPTVTPDGKRFSVIRVEKDSTQRLWSFALDGSDPRLVFERLKPVGYHVWVDANTVGMFVLGNPNALVIGDVPSGRADTVGRDIGRLLLREPGNTPAFTFVQRHDSTWTIGRWSREKAGTAGRAEDTGRRLPSRGDYLAYCGSDCVLTPSGSRLLRWNAQSSSWDPVADLAGAGIQGISRLAVSPDFKWIAIVAAEPGKP